MTTKYFNNTMPGMPTLSAAAGGMNAFLKIMLPMFGWSIEYDSGGVVVYRNDPLAPGSSGCYVRVDNTVALATIKAYKTMSDIDTGTESIPAAATTIPPMTANWQIIGDERTIYLNVAQVSGSVAHRAIYAFGDYTSAIPGDEYNYFVSGSSYTGMPNNIANHGSIFVRTTASPNRSLARGTESTPNTETQFYTFGYSNLNSGHLTSPPVVSGQYILKPYLMYSSTGMNGILRGCYCLENTRIDSFFCEYASPEFTLPLKGFNVIGDNTGGVAFSQENWI